MSASRTLRQLSISSSRALSTRSACAARVRLLTPAVMQVTRAFSASPRAFGQGTTDTALSAKLQEELNYEIEGVTPKETPDFIKEFNAQGIWKIEDVPFSEEISFTRTFGNEQIRLTFSVEDLRHEVEEDYENEEQQDSEAPDEEQTVTAYPITISLTITKGAGHGCLALDLQCQDGQFLVTNFAFYPEAKIGTEMSADADFKRHGIYAGPQFDVLDMTLQEEVERFLEERGLNESLASFIPDYAEYKEQEEYTRWLKKVKAFIDA